MRVLVQLATLTRRGPRATLSLRRGLLNTVADLLPRKTVSSYFEDPLPPNPAPAGVRHVECASRIYLTCVESVAR